MANFGEVIGQLLFAVFVGFILLNKMFEWWFKSQDDDYDEEL